MTYKIITGQYELGTEDQQAGYKMLLGEDNIQYKFDLYFHWYNIVHELGHCVVDSQKINMSKYEGTICANNAFKVLENAIANINKLDINPIQVDIELVDNPMIQCAQQCD